MLELLKFILYSFSRKSCCLKDAGVRVGVPGRVLNSIDQLYMCVFSEGESKCTGDESVVIHIGMLFDIQ